MDLRKASAADVDGIIACIDAAYQKYRSEGIELPAVSAGVATDVRDNLVWVAVEESKVAGVLIAVAGASGWHLANLAVSPVCAGRGVARALLGVMEDAAMRAGVTDLALTTHVDMPDNVAIYTRLGWVEAGREGNKVYMARRLAPEAKE
jgi:GNAT superfamily N-acetyltransferase